MDFNKDVVVYFLDPSDTEVSLNTKVLETMGVVFTPLFSDRLNLNELKKNSSRALLIVQRVRDEKNFNGFFLE